MDKRILISAPISNRDWILPYYLRNLYQLDYNKKLIDIYWIINNSCDNSYLILKEFQEKYKNEYNSIQIEICNSQHSFKDERTTSTRQKYTYSWLAYLRNKTLAKTVKLRNDFLFSLDCDILLRSDTLTRLLEHEKPIVSSLIYNGYLHQDKIGYKYPNILREISPRNYQHIVNYKIKNPHENPKGTIIPVDYTGACFTISKDVCKVARFADNKIFGEDEPFMYSARQAGFSAFCDISLYNQHVMSSELLEEFKNFQ